MFTPTAWHKTTGVNAIRFFSYSDDPEMKNPETHKEWLVKRNAGIGGSDISAIAGVNPWRSAIDVFLDKTGRTADFDNERMLWGRILEQPIALEFAEREGITVKKINSILQHKDHDYALVNLDRLIVKNGKPLDSEISKIHERLLKEGNGALEIKTTGWAKSWANDEIPDYYYTQLQWQLGITGLKWGKFATLVSGQELIQPPIVDFNEKVFNNLLIIAGRFWHDHVLKDRAPAPDLNPRTKEAMKLLYPDMHDETINIPNTLNDSIRKRKQLDAAIKAANSQKAAIDSLVLSNMQNSKYGLTDQFKVTRVLRSGVSIDGKSHKEKCPECHAKFSKSSESIYPTYKELKLSKDI